MGGCCGCGSSSEEPKTNTEETPEEEMDDEDLGDDETGDASDDSE